jgi:hypothetical protein
MATDIPQSVLRRADEVIGRALEIAAATSLQ